MGTKFHSEVFNVSDSSDEKLLLNQEFKKTVTQYVNNKVLVHPCKIDGKPTLVYQKGLPESNKKAFLYIKQYAKENGYQLKQDRRSNFIEGVKRVKNSSCANVMTIVVLSASLFAQNALAKNNNDGQFVIDADSDALTQSQIIQGRDFNLDNFHNDRELVVGLVEWINAHSSFNYRADDLPEVKKVSSVEIAEVAFGGKLSEALDPDSLNIYGLYNFNEKAVYILDSLDLTSTEGVAILLHEVVHFLQYQYDHDKNVECKNELESLAYTLEAEFLNAHDHPHNINVKHIDKVSQCKIS